MKLTWTDKEKSRLIIMKETTPLTAIGIAEALTNEFGRKFTKGMVCGVWRRMEKYGVIGSMKCEDAITCTLEAIFDFYTAQGWLSKKGDKFHANGKTQSFIQSLKP